MSGTPNVSPARLTCWDEMYKTESMGSAPERLTRVVLLSHTFASVGSPSTPHLTSRFSSGIPEYLYARIWNR